MKLKDTIKVLILLMMPSFAFSGHASQGVIPYRYEDTRQLVSLVEQAAALIESRGRDAFREFGVPGSPWLHETYYIFIYTLDGVCAFHPISPQLVGANLMHLKDMDGKPVIRMITDIGRKPEKKAAGWVFYLWEERTQFIPLWKSSYIRKAVAPDGTIYTVGCGSYNIKMEKAFIKERVDLAVDLLKTKGKDIAFAQFRDTSTIFHFLDTYIFVMDNRGQSVVDPSFPGMRRDLTGFKDALGRYVVKEMLQKLAKNDEAWIQYMWPKPGGHLPSRKIAYIRKVSIGGDVFILGSDFFSASPIWMKM